MLKALMCVVILGACAVVALLEVRDGHLPAALAFGGFAFGYGGLAWMYA